jgi:hypothetical protein
MHAHVKRPFDYHDHMLKTIWSLSNNGRSVKLSYPQNTEFNPLQPQENTNFGDIPSQLPGTSVSGMDLSNAHWPGCSWMNLLTDVCLVLWTTVDGKVIWWLPEPTVLILEKLEFGCRHEKHTVAIWKLRVTSALAWSVRGEVGGERTECVGC